MSRPRARNRRALRHPDSRRRGGGRTPPRLQILTTALPGLLAVIAMIATWVSVSQTAEQLDIAEQGQLTGRFNDAVKNMGSGEPATALGGVAALQRIMEDSPPDQPRVMTVLSTYVRSRAARPPCADSEGTEQPEKNEQAEKPVEPPEPTPLPCDGTGYVRQDSATHRPPVEIEEIVDVLAHRTNEHDGRSQIELRSVDLRGLAVSPYKVKEATQFYRSTLPTPPDHLNLSEANLGGSDLRGASFFRTDLRGTNFWGANLNGAVFTDVMLQTANLEKVEAEKAEMQCTREGCVDLEDADLSYANLRNALLGVRTSDGRTWWQRTSEKPICMG